MEDPARELLNPREGWDMGHGIVARSNNNIVKPGNLYHDRMMPRL